MPFNLCKTVEVEPVVKLTVSHEKLGRLQDDLSERSSSTPNTKEIPYHLLEVKVAEIQEQIENIASDSVPLNKQLVSRVKTNENGIAKCMLMIADLTKEMQDLRDEHKQQTGQIKGCMSAIADMTKEMQDLRDEHKQQTGQIKGNDVNDKFNSCHDDYKQFVTRVELEDALQSTRKGLESKLPSPDVIDQFVTLEELTDVMQGTEKDLESKLSSSDAFKQFVTRAEVKDYVQGVGKDLESNLSPRDDFEQVWTLGGLADALKDIRQDAENLQQPPEKVEIEMSSETDSVPSRPTSSHSVKLYQLTESHESLNRQVEELGAEMRNKLDQGALAGLNVSSELLEQPQELKEQDDAPAAAREQISEPLEPLASPSLLSLVSNEDPLVKHKMELQGLDIARLEMKVSLLKDQLDLIQDMISHDSTRWDIRHGTNFEEEIRNIFIQNEPDKTKNFAYVVDDQLHDIRNNIKKMNGVQDALLKSENETREEFKKMLAYCHELQGSKADRTEVDVKADKTSLDKKVDHSLFNSQTNDVGKTFNIIVDQMDENEEAWNQQRKVLRDDIDGKVDRLELEPLKKWLLKRLKALVNKLNKRNQAPVEWVDDTADQKEWVHSRPQALVDKLKKKNEAPVELIDDTADQKESLHSRLEALDDKLNKQNQAPVEWVDDAADQKEWVHSRPQALVDKLKKKNEAPVELIDDTADQKESLHSRLEALDDKLNKQNQAPVQWIDDAADQKESLHSRLEVLDDKLKKKKETPVDLIDDTADQKESLHSRLEALDDKLNKQNQAPVQWIDDAADQKESLHSRLEVLDNELKKKKEAPVDLIDDAADQKEWVHSRREVLDDELKKRNQAPVEWVDDAAAGIRSLVPLSIPSVSSHQALLPRRSQRPCLTFKTDQIQQHENSLVPLSIPSVSNHQALLPRRSQRPRLSLKMDQIRQDAKSNTSMFPRINRSQSIIKLDNTTTERPKTRRSQSNIYFDSNVTERPKAIMSKTDEEAFQFHFGTNAEDFQKGFLIQRMDRNDNANADCYATNRSCGGQHTTTYPQNIWAKLPRIREDKEAKRG